MEGHILQVRYEIILGIQRRCNNLSTTRRMVQSITFSIAGARRAALQLFNSNAQRTCYNVSKLYGLYISNFFPRAFSPLTGLVIFTRVLLRLFTKRPTLSRFYVHTTKVITFPVSSWCLNSLLWYQVKYTMQKLRVTVSHEILYTSANFKYLERRDFGHFVTSIYSLVKIIQKNIVENVTCVFLRENINKLQKKVTKFILINVLRVR